MCGRFALATKRPAFEEMFHTPMPDDLDDRYNIAPQQDIVAITPGGATMLRWGLVPHWARDAKIGHKLINARSETVFHKPSFRDAVKFRRCLIPVSAFYEWKKTGRARQPHAISLKDTNMFAFAGISSQWVNPETGEVLSTCSILTTAPNILMADIHDRMPVILDTTNHERWLDQIITAPNQLDDLFVPFPAERMKVWEVSSAVNMVGSEGPGLLNPTGNRQASLL